MGDGEMVTVALPREDEGRGVDLWVEQDEDVASGGERERRIVLRLVVDGEDIAAWAGWARVSADGAMLESDGILEADLIDGRRGLVLRGADGAVQMVAVDALVRRSRAALKVHAATRR